MAEKLGLRTEEVAAMSALIEIAIGENVPDSIQVQAINKLLEIRKKNENYFDVVIDSELSLGTCPCCGHKNHWLVPETELNVRGIVTHKTDERVKPFTSSADCPEYAEACSKKKVSI
jgi:hypothetical protein